MTAPARDDRKTSIWIGGREIAERLEISLLTFQRNLDRLCRDEGFPLPSAHRVKPQVWRRAAVEAWIDSQGYAADDLRDTPTGRDPGTAQVHLLRLARTAS